MRTIDANVAIKGLIEIRNNLREGFPKQFQQETIRKALRVVEEAPTITYEDLVPHGRWIITKEYDEIIDLEIVKYTCSVCGKYHLTGAEVNLATNFCSSCGAKMNGEKNNESD